MNYIDDERKWRVSMSGASIRTGWGDEKKMIAFPPFHIIHATDEQWEEWLENAEKICELYNSSLKSNV